MQEVIDIMAKYTGYDFCGWATRNDLRCADGRTIRDGAFAHQDGARVPLVWGHNHDDPEAVLGHGYLENVPGEGVKFYAYFNDSPLAEAAKRDVRHGDVTSLSIWANQLQQRAGDVLHGSIKEVSLVLAGANVGAQITYPVVAHGDDWETNMNEAYIYVGEEFGLELSHADDEEGASDMNEEKTVQDVIDTMDDDQLKVMSYLIGKAATDGLEGLEEDDDDENDDDEVQHADLDEDATVQDVLDTMDENQMKVLTYLVGKAAAEGLGDREDDDEDEEEDDDEDLEHSYLGGEGIMNFNAFDNVQTVGVHLSHGDQEDIIATAKKYGKFSEALQAYAEVNNIQHDDLAAVSGFTSYPDGSTPAGVDSLFPEWHDVRPGAPEIVTNDQAWVQAVLRGVHRSPYSRVRTSQVDLREIEANLAAKGYDKGTEKALQGRYKVAKRTTEPDTIYVKSALNRDDIVDITDFDYVQYQYRIDRMMLEKELAKAILIGDGREDTASDKIDPEHIRPIYGDDELFTIYKTVKLGNSNGTNTGANFGDGYRYAQATEEALLDARIDYRGSGALAMFCTQQYFNKLILAKDLNGRRIYNNKNELLAALDVDVLYVVPEMAGKTRTVGDKTMKLLAIFVNLSDYNLGATKGGEITHFQQFDIDFNQEKSLIETRVSGANTRVQSAIVLEEEAA